MTYAEAGRYALIVATGEYADPRLQALRSPEADADHLANVLRDPAIGGFEVILAKDETSSDLRWRLADFLSKRRRDDLLFLHFSCHGVKDETGALYLAAADTDKDVLSATAIEARWLNDRIAHTRSARVVLLLDCCYSGSFPSDMRARADEGVDVKDHLGGRGRAVITASTSTEYAYEGDALKGEGQPSIFTGAIVDALQTGKADRDQDRRIEVAELYHYVHDRVTEATPNQKPRMSNDLEGPFYIAKSSYEAPVEPATLDDRVLSLTESPIAGARLGAVEELATLLRSGDRAVVLAARQKLASLVDDDSRRVSQRAQAALASEVEPPHEVKPPREDIGSHPSPPDSPGGDALLPDKGSLSKALKRWSSARRVAIASAVAFVLGSVVVGSDGTETSSAESSTAADTIGALIIIAGAVGLLVAGVLALLNRQKRRRNQSQ